MDAIVLAGGIATEKDPLFTLSPGGLKALIPLAGKPMIQWVLDALDESGEFATISIIGLPTQSDVISKPHYHFLEDRGGIIENIQAGCQYLVDTLQRDPQQVAVTASADIPAVQPHMVNWLVEQVKGSNHDLYYCVVEQQSMEKRYPGSRRTYVPLKGMRICGGDLNALRLHAALHTSPLTKKLAAARKNIVKQASLIGINTLTLLLLRQLDLHAAEHKISRRLGISGKALLCPYPEIGMDVDKPFQYDIILKDLIATNDIRL